jgi:hypothetical protein
MTMAYEEIPQVEVVQNEGKEKKSSLQLGIDSSRKVIKEIKKRFLN